MIGKAIAGALALFLCVCLSALSRDAAKPEESQEIFNGKDLTGWVVEGPKTFKDAEKKDQPIWVARDGMISCMVDKNSFGFLRYEKTYKDFELQLEYRFEKPAPKAKRGNSGVGIRTTVYDPKKSEQTRPSMYGYEIQLLDDYDRKPDKHSTGSLYRYVTPSESAAKAAPQWNQLTVRCIGPKITVTLNEKKIIDVDQSTIKEIEKKPLEGYISLQNHSSKVDFRKIRVREIKEK
jgi:hypothetical protein